MKCCVEYDTRSSKSKSLILSPETKSDREVLNQLYRKYHKSTKANDKFSYDTPTTGDLQFDEAFTRLVNSDTSNWVSDIHKVIRSICKVNNIKYEEYYKTLYNRLSKRCNVDLAVLLNDLIIRLSTTGEYSNTKLKRVRYVDAINTRDDLRSEFNDIVVYEARSKMKFKEKEI